MIEERIEWGWSRKKILAKIMYYRLNSDHPDHFRDGIWRQKEYVAIKQFLLDVWSYDKEDLILQLMDEEQ